MNRSDFLALGSSVFLTALTGMNTSEPEAILFQDDGSIPNSRYPLLLYRNAFSETGPAGAAWLEKLFSSNNWTNSWRNGVFPYHHYHSITHEVLGVYSGSALLHLGGEKGRKIRVQTGDVIVIPAGVGHKRLEASPDFGVVGAYPDGRDYDVLRGEPGDRPQADQNIAAVPLPKTDPLHGAKTGLIRIWH
ncbi:cupin [Larkinella sp. VNQ87]|uniref:cupin n=1 Tax=Larkinella sp. VNQ87 TaxID=3400921 RepID=UPI003BFD4769